MPKRTLFADTNVFLHCKFFDELDWRMCVSGDEVVLTLCPAVVSELDKKKFSDPSPRVRDRAKRVMRRVWELVKDDQPVRFRQGCSLWLTCREPLMDFALANLSRDVIDDVILASALEQRDKGDDVAIVSADTGLRVKAASRRLPVVVLPDAWLLEDEPDERERQFRELQRELAALKAASPNLRLTVAENTVAEFSVRGRQCVPSSACRSQPPNHNADSGRNSLSAPRRGPHVVGPAGFS